MSKQQYNLSTKTDYSNRKMFLDPAGPVTIQRFEEVKYNKIADFEKTARGFFWVPEEISLSKDANDFKEAAMQSNTYSPVTYYGKLLLTVCKGVDQVRSLHQLWACQN
jgi:ribonucleotide reductase beta subunit family protein with ferritin-like domain